VVLLRGREVGQKPRDLGTERSEGRTDLAMVETCVEPFSMDKFKSQQQSPMFFCSALTNFGVENILQRFLEIAPAPGPLPTIDGAIPQTRRSSAASSTRSRPTWTRCTATASRSCA
jgi:peptide subunit release factor RF-3